MQQKDSGNDCCLACGTSPIQSRGLCAKHHSRYHRELRDLTAAQKVIYEKTLIERGLLLPPKPPGRQVTKDPFKEIAAELFVAEKDQDFETEGAANKKPGRKKKKANGKKKP